MYVLTANAGLFVQESIISSIRVALQDDGWSALHYGTMVQPVRLGSPDLDPHAHVLCLTLQLEAAANDAALAAEVLVQFDTSTKACTHSTNETALEMAERLRSNLVAILLYEVMYRKE